MSYNDFCRLWPEEWNEVCKAWSETLESDNREAWERTRMHAAICVQPWTKKKITPKQLMQFPWDIRKPIRHKPIPTPEQEKKRVAELLKRLGK